MKSVCSNTHEIQKKKAKDGPSKVRVHKTILENFSNNLAQSEGEDSNDEGEEEKEEEEKEGIDHEA
jgi:hypothetical protein